MGRAVLMRKPPEEWIAPWVRAWRVVGRKARLSGLVCWLTRHHTMSDRDAEGGRRHYLVFCVRCGSRWHERTEELRNGHWIEVHVPPERIAEWLWANNEEAPF